MSTRILLELRDVRFDVHHSQTVIVQRLEENRPHGSERRSSDLHDPTPVSIEQSASEENIADHASESPQQGGHLTSATEPQDETRHLELSLLEQEAGERIAIIQRLVSDVLAQQTLRVSQLGS